MQGNKGERNGVVETVPQKGGWHILTLAGGGEKFCTVHGARPPLLRTTRLGGGGSWGPKDEQNNEGEKKRKARKNLGGPSWGGGGEACNWKRKVEQK